jgi:hypothetical protein
MMLNQANAATMLLMAVGLVGVGRLSAVRTVPIQPGQMISRSRLIAGMQQGTFSLNGKNHQVRHKSA